MQHIFDLLLNSERLNRIYQDRYFTSKTDYISYILKHIQPLNAQYSNADAIRIDLFTTMLIKKWFAKNINIPVKRAIFNVLSDMNNSSTIPYFISYRIKKFNDGQIEMEDLPKASTLPPGSPIGMDRCEWGHFHEH